MSDDTATTSVGIPTDDTPPQPDADRSDERSEEPGFAVTVRFFAMLRERRGRDAERVEVPEGTTVGQLHQRLFAGQPELSMPVLYAVDQAYVPASTPLQDGCEVAFIPPLGGG
ncbi:MAG: MoaD/ThiS family protein [Deltaproteobacteria bacterium]|nr:MAG: MoaD/ThiS family protein [Deltaproteobacteria bacterium]